jgi:hypothetical protein
MYQRLKKLLRNLYFDLRFSGRFLGGNKSTPHADQGAFNTVNTDYDILPFLFGKIAILPRDTLVDVGCGKGRVIVYWLSLGLKNRLVGIELDKDVADHTKAQFRKVPNVEVLCGDVNTVFEGGPAGGHEIFYLYNPFNREVMARFEAKLHHLSLDRPITVIYHRCEYVEVFLEAGRWNVEQLEFSHASGYRSRSAIVTSFRPGDPARGSARSSTTPATT